MNGLGAWMALNYQFLAVIGGLILTNLNFRTITEVFKVKIGHLEKQGDKHERQIEQLQATQ